MRTLSRYSRAVVLSSVLAAWAVLGFACTVEDENPATTRPRGAEAGSDGTTATEDGSNTPTGAPLCGKYGGTAAISALADSIVSAAIGDCRIGLIVENARNKDQAHFDECFQKFVGGGFQCPGVSFSSGQTTDSKGKKCTKPLENVTFTKADFDAFFSDATAALKAKALTDDEIRSIAPVFEGARLSLQGSTSTKHTACRPSCDIAKDACTPAIVDAGNNNDTGTHDSGVNDSGNDTAAPDATDQ
jgi:hypothetical protein